MNILSQNGDTLVNYDNAASLYIQKVCLQYDTYWEIRVMYPAVSTDVLCDALAKFYTEEKCIKVFNELINCICNGITFVRIKDLSST